MDNESENNVNDVSEQFQENKTSSETSDLSDGGLNLDFLSGKIKESLNSNPDILSADASSGGIDPFMQAQTSDVHVPLPDVHVETSVKKYVIHVDPENIDYMEHLTINERRQVINKILKEQSILTKEEIKAAKIKKRITHTIIMVLTFSIFFPLLFIAITSAAKLTYATYATSKSNFSKLYRENGVIKRKK